MSRAGGKATQTVAQLILVISHHLELLPLVAAWFPQAQSAHRVSITAHQAASSEGATLGPPRSSSRSCKHAEEALLSLKDPVRFQTGSYFPSSAQEAPANTHQLCRADAVGLEGRGSQLSHLPWGLDPRPKRSLELRFLSGAVPVCSHCCTNPSSQLPGFGEQAHATLRKGQALLGSLTTGPGCIEPFTLQPPPLRPTHDTSRTGQHQTSCPAWTSFLNALTLVPVGGQEADRSLTTLRVTRG